MLPRQLRVGDFVDDYCPRERRLTDHAIVAMVEDDVRQVRCTACAGEHEYRKGKVPVSRKKKPGLPAPPAGAGQAPATLPATAATAPALADSDPSVKPALAAPADTASVQGSAGPPATDEPVDPPQPGQDGPFHRRLIRATLPKIEGAEVPARPIPEFTMHRPPASPHRFGRPFRPGQPGGGQHRPGGKGPGGARHGGARHGQGQGPSDGNTFGNRGGRGGHGGPGGAVGPGGPRPSRPGFGQRPPRGPKKH